MKIFYVLIILMTHCIFSGQNIQKKDITDSENNEPKKISEMAIYPGCEKFEGKKNELIKCFGEKLQHDILRFMDTEYPDDAALKKQVVVLLEFDIDTLGRIVNVKANKGDQELFAEAERSLNAAANYLVNKGKVIQPAKFEDGTPAQIIFATRVGLSNPDYAENWIYYLYKQGKTPEAILIELKDKGVTQYNLKKVKKLIEKINNKK